jgi:threonine aldolase
MIDLYSDTLTQPTPAMRKAMADAPVGDEQRREDPTTNRLQERVAEILGKEAAVFLPSGAMCNAVAIKTHTQPGDAILCDRFAHIYRSEFGGPALLSGVTTEPIDGEAGHLTVEQVTEALARFGGYGARPRLLCVEQTHNFGGGTVWPLKQLHDVCKFAHDRGLSTHMDGARLFNASIASGISPKEFAKECDSVWVDFSKGLGCAVGAVLAGSKDFIANAWRWKHLFGGAMRQSGILAAGCIYALDHHVERLREDHENAKLLARGLAGIDGIHLITPSPQTNIVFVRISDGKMTSTDFVQRALDRGVRFSGLAAGIRAVTHLDISKRDIETALQAVSEILKGKS